MSVLFKQKIKPNNYEKKVNLRKFELDKLTVTKLSNPIGIKAGFRQLYRNGIYYDLRDDDTGDTRY
ncbi:hypothetical protein ABW636_04440 [Aquimarina sp. 2201CG1-2-11]|uniref:hypothetical protein n=1 Tax=Aquimarina discodermiae TaxID=3231043 RepID=UPI0034621990